MSNLLKLLVVILTITGFCWLAEKSLQHEKRKGHGYTAQQISALDQIIAATNKTQWGDNQKKLADLWQLSESDVAQPINLWRAK